ncbi:hypothetical protein LKO27_01805 [Tessaracoccus sp. OS52]|uniref:hypothetical protein n=1 Tax=Tessaracoccus sp. OS52 TaxID=2886691 RepID=UPI001D12D718|nr:hypothetical protein [Tessaracoccus sp. OS52]MCC2592160.1 hypothetical protein [Tessaracoccus sp. OS52]
MTAGGWQPTPGSYPPRPDGHQTPVPPRDLSGEDAQSQATPPRPDAGVIRPIPAGTDERSFDAIAMQSVLSRARDSRRFDAPEVDTDGPTARPFPLKAVLITLVSVMVLGVAGGLFYVRFLRNVAPDPETVVSASATASREVLRTPHDAVRGYFEALAAGDIESALTYGPPGGTGSMLLLSPENHARMPEASRPSNLTILTEDPLASEVEVRYDLAGEQVSTGIRVIRLDTGDYQLARTTVTVLTQVAGGDNLPMFINGAEADHTIPLEVVPGTYTLSTNLPFITYPESNSFRIQSLAYTDVTAFPVNPQLTAEGREALQRAARASLSKCMATSELTPTGCPNAIRANKPVTPGSVKWTLLNDPWQSFSPTLFSDDQAVATATVPLDYRVVMDYTDGRNSGNNDISRIVRVSATMLGRDASDVVVTWDR